MLVFVRNMLLDYDCLLDKAALTQRAMDVSSRLLVSVRVRPPLVRYGFDLGLVFWRFCHGLFSRLLLDWSVRCSARDPRAMDVRSGLV